VNKVIAVKMSKIPKAGREELLGYLLVRLAERGKATPEDMRLLQDLLFRSVLQRIAA